ncbi:MAG: S46 family peptidase [Planctomycetes bacterium]|nr:S46 family peptidase [Planctomycetota bacterium]
MTHPIPSSARPCRLRPVLSTLLAATVCLGSATAQIRKELGRMWTFEAAPLGWFQQAYDFTPSQQWLDHARLSSLRLGKRNPEVDGGIQWFCSASFVSPYGLIMTNHHCSRDAIVSVQGDNDWLKDGFYAGDFAGEVKIPDVLVSQLVSTRDVTKEVAADGIEAVRAAAEQAQPELLHQVIALYQGGNYQLYSHKIYDDLRLVCAPHGQSAHFGGDPDNFCYPRWGLDFSFLRAWDGDKPLDTKANCFRWKTEGAQEGDLVFVTGNPGRTGRLQTLAQCEYLRDHFYPGQLERLHAMLDRMYAAAAESPEKEKELRATILRYENGRKAYRGYLDGLQNPRILAIKQKAERELRAAVDADAKLQAAYGDAWDKVAELQRQKVAAAGDVEAMKDLVAQEAEQQKRIGEACFAVYGTEVPPDATMSLRISDGVVKGYAMNGTLAPWFTTLYGLFGRHAEFGGKHPFDLPQAWLDKEKQLDLATPFNFVATCDIIGGNSGSPMIDRDQNVVGLIFDGNIEMLGNNYVFDDEIGRTVSVHPAIIVEALRKVYDAKPLADELEYPQAGLVAMATSVRRNVLGAIDEAKSTKAEVDVRVIADAVRSYRARNGKLPKTLAVLATQDDRGRSELEELPQDPWGHDYDLREGDRPSDWEVRSAGPDGKLDTDDDITSRKRAVR